MTVNTDYFKVTTTGKMTRSLDRTAVWEVQKSLSNELFDLLFEYKPSLNLAVYRDLERSNHEAFMLASAAVTTKPAKTAVKVEIIAPMPTNSGEAA